MPSEKITISALRRLLPVGTKITALKHTTRPDYKYIGVERKVVSNSPREIEIGTGGEADTSGLPLKGVEVTYDKEASTFTITAIVTTITYKIG